MLRVDLSATPMAWNTVKIPTDDEPAELRVRYRILRKDDVDVRSTERLELAKLIKAGDEVEALAAIMDRLTPEQRERMRSDVLGSIAEWDLQDMDGQPVPVTAEAVTALCDYGIYLIPLYDGLIEASNGAARKNA